MIYFVIYVEILTKLHDGKNIKYKIKRKKWKTQEIERILRWQRVCVQVKERTLLSAD